MFSKGNTRTTSAPVQPQKAAAPSLVSSDLVITGNLQSVGEIQIDGTVKGDIDSNILLVGESANIEGEIVAEKLRVHGRVTGQIKARNVSLAKTAHVVGDILHENLSIEEGAYLEGLCRRLNKGEFRTDQQAGLNVKETARKALGGGETTKKIAAS